MKIQPLTPATIADIFDPAKPKSLEDLCAAFGMPIKQNHVPSVEEIKRINARFKSRGQQLCENAIGQQFKVRMEKNVAITGTIVSAEPIATRNRGRSVVQQFRIVLECGSAKVRREAIVEALPR